MTDFRKTEFLRSAASPEGFYRDRLPQVVFAGRSNVGKSSVINCLADRKNLAHVGSMPGKTTQINYFLTEKRVYLVDLPGYGYAKVSKGERDRWGKLMESFFSQADRIALGVLIVDARHAPTEDDVRMYDWFRQKGRPVLVIANKADKLKRSEEASSLAVIRRVFGMETDDALILFSAERKTGREALAAGIEKAAAL